MRNLQIIVDDIAKFSDETFGVDRPFTAPLHHLKKEVDEVIESGELEEYADCLLLLCDSFRKRHPELDADDLIESAYQKIKVCRQRTWGKPDQNGVIEHIRNEQK